MVWLKKIFKSSNLRIHEGQHHGKYGEDKVWNETFHSLDVASDRENEEIDRAIALSLSEEEHKKAKAIESGPSVEEYEQLARAIQESLNIEFSPHYHGHTYQPFPFFYPSGYRMQKRDWSWTISQFYGFGTQNVFAAMFSMYVNHPYHKSCYREQYHPKCDGCKLYIRTNMVSLIEYRAHPFWLQKYCPGHEHDGTPKCCSCERMEPRDIKYITLDDGRKLCLECLDSAIMETNECQSLYLSIQEFYEGLNMEVGQKIPLLLVERQALNEALEGEKNGHHPLPETRGLCLAEE